jgi:hypothetical protein
MAVNIFELSSTDWNTYVRQHPKGTIFHTQEMKAVFDRTPGHETMFIGARDKDQKIVALLAAVKVRVLGRLSSRLSTRSVMFAQPICDDTETGREAIAELLKHHDRVWGSRVLFTEIRLVHPVDYELSAFESQGYEHLGYFNYINDLQDGTNVLAPRIKKTMRKVRTNRKRGLQITLLENPSPADIHRVYQQIQMSYQRAKVPLAHEDFLTAANESLPESVLQLRIATTEDGQDVGAAVGLVYGDRFYAWYNGNSRPAGLSVGHSLVWDEINTSCQQALSWYDFGGAGWPDEDYGPRTFKRRFGGEKVNYGRFRKIGSKLRMAIAKTGYQMVRGLLTSEHRSPKSRRSLKSVNQDNVQ